MASMNCPSCGPIYHHPVVVEKQALLDTATRIHVEREFQIAAMAKRIAADLPPLHAALDDLDRHLYTDVFGLLEDLASDVDALTTSDPHWEVTAMCPDYLRTGNSSGSLTGSDGGAA